MNIFFSGVGGVGIGPLAEIAKDAGHHVVGSDVSESPVTKRLEEQGITVHIGQDGAFFQEINDSEALDWFVYTSALPDNHPELEMARMLGIKTAKRDELLAEIIKEKNLKLIAVAGTHGKTTTTGMLVWAFQQLGIPASYSIGTTVSYGPSGRYEPGSKYFVYECDEYDRNFLHFTPSLSLITSVDYDHPDTYPTVDEYKDAFVTFLKQSSHAILWNKDDDYLGSPLKNHVWSLAPSDVLPLSLPGEHNRRNGTLVVKALEYLQLADAGKSIEALNSFPGTDRRFEKLADNLYSDYGHHPAEIAATLQLASELSDHVVLVYQPHQNVRQHEIKDEYRDQFEHAETIYWLPTYLTREDPHLHVYSPEELTEHVTNRDAIHYAELDDDLWQKIQEARDAGKLVLAMGAGTIDGWIRKHLA